MERYKKAPISELVLGVTFKRPELVQDNKLYKMIAKLSSEYPHTVEQEPLATEMLKDFRLNIIIDPSIKKLVRMQTHDKSQMIQIQNNKIYFNWFREDNISVEEANYPGFSSQMNKLTDTCKEVLGDDFKNPEKYLQYEVTYVDRIEWTDYIRDLSQIGEILNINTIDFSDQKYGEILSNNVNSAYTYPVIAIGGYCTLKISTRTSRIDEKTQILSVENYLRGHMENVNLDEWFTISRELQYNMFLKTFNSKTLSVWK